MYRWKKWSVSFVNDLLWKLEKTGLVNGNGRSRSVRTHRNISRVSDRHAVNRYKTILSLGIAISLHEIDKLPRSFACVLCCVALCVTEHACVLLLCIERGMLWQKVNLANKHVTFQDKMDVVLFVENYLRLNGILGYSALCVRLFLMNN